MKLNRLFLLIFLFPLLASAQTPTLVQHVSCANSGAAGSGAGGTGPISSTPDYKCPLPEPTQAGNALILGFYSDNTNNPTWTVSDDKANTWVQAVSLTDGSKLMSIYYALNVAAGTHMLNVHQTTATNGFMSVTASEYFNVALTSALDTSLCNAGSSSTTIATGNITPTVSGDLLWQYAANKNQTPISPFSAGSQMALGAYWLLNGTDIAYGNAVQAGVYTATAQINPTFTSGTAQPFDSCVIALKPAPVGNPTGNSPSKTFRIVHMLHQAILAGSRQTFPAQFPASGNLILASHIAGTDQISSISSVPSNTWTQVGSALSYGSDVVSQIYYAGNATTSNAMTLSFSRDQTGDATEIIYDVTGADVSPFDKGSPGETNTQHNIVSSLTTCAGCMAPSGVTGANELVIGNVGNAWCTNIAVTSPVGSIFDTATYTGNGWNGPEDVDQNNGWFHLYTSSTSPLTVTWTYTCDGVNPQEDWAGRLAAFKSASSVAQQPPPPTQLKAVVN